MVNTQILLIAMSLFVTMSSWSLAQDSDLGSVDASLLPTGRLIRPVGDNIEFHGRPVDLCLGPQGKRLFVKDRSSLRVIDIEGGKFELRQTVSSPDGASLLGMACDEKGNVYFTNAKQGLHVFAAKQTSGEEDGGYELSRTIKLPTDSFPCGICLIDDRNALVCLSKKNELVRVDLATGKVVATVAVGVAPFAVDVDEKNGLAFVSNIGGRRAAEADLTASSAGTQVVVDQRGIASTGTVSVVDLGQFKVVQEVAVGLHPGAMTFASQELLVCNGNSDSISRLRRDAESGLEASRFTVKPDDELPFGSMPTAVFRSSDQRRLLVALAGNNAVCVYDSENSVASSKSPVRLGLIPTGWYPAAIAANEKYVFVANVKGNGARSRQRDKAKGFNSHDHQGTVQRIAWSDILNPSKLDAWTEQVHRDSRIPQILRSRLAQPSDDRVQPTPLPKRLGDPSVFKHVIYVIKENRTFDQVFGDIKEARSDVSLCTFPEKITPNHHALARQFGILDNYYCNGVLSADGHSWATEGNVTPYLERAFGGFARSYTFGDDPITYSSSGFIWDHILAAGLSFRNYGEMDYSKPPAGMKYQEIWKAYQAKEKTEFQQQIGIERLRKYSCRDYPGWNMVIPDVLRMDRFLNEFREFERNNGLPNFTIVYLPQDHLGGGVTSHAHMADNDLALGRLVDAVSHSRYWKDTAIIVNEDDPQNGFDHIDGHRSLCLVISAYSRAGVNHNFYNQTSVLRTILHMFGLPPMNQQDGSAPLMHDCFDVTVNQPPFKVRPANIALNETPKPPAKQSQSEKKWRRILATVPIERTGMKTPQDEDHLNRFLWHETMGWQSPYPEEFAGPHGAGLGQLGLVFGGTERDE